MKNVLISLFALAAISGTAFASDYGNDKGSYIRKPVIAASSALVVVKSKKKLTAFERMNKISEDNEHGDKGSDHSSND